jgi:Uma2 family endonuclease
LWLKGGEAVTSGLTVLKDKVYTVEDYMKLDDDNRYELIDGFLIREPRPRYEHQKTGGRLYNQIANYLQHNPVGEVIYEMDVHLGDKVVGPDVLFVAQERRSIIGELYLTAAPDLVVEVLSPSTAAYV